MGDGVTSVWVSALHSEEQTHGRKVRAGRRLWADNGGTAETTPRLGRLVPQIADELFPKRGPTGVLVVRVAGPGAARMPRGRVPGTQPGGCRARARC